MVHALAKAQWFAVRSLQRPENPRCFAEDTSWHLSVPPISRKSLGQCMVWFTDSVSIVASGTF